MNISLLSAYHSGSHKSWAEGYIAHSQHNIALHSMPGRFWKWRMHGGALSLAQKLLDADDPIDLILTDGMTDVTTLLAMTRHKTHTVPVALYMHENQLTYPLPKDPETGAMRRNHNERDHHYVFINYSSMMASSQIIFNSRYHLESWFEALPRYLRHYPDHRNMQNCDMLRERSTVLPVGIRLPVVASTESQTDELPPLILWNQRWEYDKNPEAFFAALYAVQERGIPFRLAVCGENFSRKPVVFEEAQERLSAEIIHYGFADRDVYDNLLAESDIVISTAVHEFFGISIVEAMLHGAYPILPKRLSYPELVPESVHAGVLYESDDELIERLAEVLRDVGAVQAQVREIQISAEKYAWPIVAEQYDSHFVKLVA